MDIAYCFECFPNIIVMRQINFPTFSVCMHILELRQDPLHQTCTVNSNCYFNI